MTNLTQSDHAWTPPHGPRTVRVVLPKHPQAMTAMGLGIAALAGVWFLLLPILLAPVAWWLGAKAKREIAAEPERWSGLGEAQAGLIMGVIGTVILAGGVVTVGVLTFFIGVLAF